MRKSMGRKYRERLGKTRTILNEKTKEALASVLPILMIVLYLAIGAAVIIGVLLAVRQRMREIDAGEEEDARQY